MTGETDLHRPRAQGVEDLNTRNKIIIDKFLKNSSGGETHLESSLSITPNSFWWMALKIEKLYTMKLCLYVFLPDIKFSNGEQFPKFPARTCT